MPDIESAGQRQPDVIATIRSFLGRLDKPDAEFDLNTSLYAEGLDLSSLDAAELSATLEDELGHDPFTGSGELPQTIGDIVAYYESAAGR
jgi:acyl carrier protein